MLFKVKFLLLSLMALSLTGSVVATVAYAEAGPFWHQREVGTKGGGEEVGLLAQEEVRGEGGEQRLKGEVSKTNIEVSAKSVQIKGSIYNNPRQGQAKLELVYHEPHLVKPELKECTMMIGENNKVKLLGHLAWTWNGEKTQLQEKTQQPKQKPDWIFLANEIESGATELPKGLITTVSFKGSACGLLSGTKFNLEGSVTATISPEKVEEWSKSQVIKLTEGKQKQHFWNGSASIGVETGLTLGGSAASMSGEDKLPTSEEVATFEFGGALTLTSLTFTMVPETRNLIIRNPNAFAVRVFSQSVSGPGFILTDPNVCAPRVYPGGGQCEVMITATMAMQAGAYQVETANGSIYSATLTS